MISICKRLILPAVLLCTALHGCDKGEEKFFRLEASLQEVEISCTGGQASVPVNTNTSFTATVTQGQDWIHLIIPGMSVTAVVDPLRGEQDRTGSFDINTGAGSKTVTVTQKAVTWDSVPGSVNLNNNTLNFSATITSSRRISFDIPDWISPVDTAWVSGQKTYTFAAGVYLDPGNPQRSAVLTARTDDGGTPLSKEITVTQSSYTNAAIQTIVELWNTDPIGLPMPGSARYAQLALIETYCNQCDRTAFRDTYLLSDEATAAKMEQDYAILSIYRYAFDTVLEEVKNATVQDGTTRIWMIYNCGFIFKTPSKCWGMDINHRYASKLEPYLDFMTVSHSDGDHIDNALMNAMAAKGKPVISNFYTGSSAYMSGISGTTYHLGNVTLTTAITDQNDSDPDSMTVLRVNTGSDGGNLEFVHIGDSDCKPAQYSAVQGSVDMAVMRGISPTKERRILGTGTGQIDPAYILLDHQEELRHYIDKSPMRGTIAGSIANVRNYYGTYASRTSLPFWGTALVWDGSTLKKSESR